MLDGGLYVTSLVLLFFFPFCIHDIIDFLTRRLNMNIINGLVLFHKFVALLAGLRRAFTSPRCWDAAQPGENNMPHVRYR